MRSTVASDFLHDPGAADGVPMDFFIAAVLDAADPAPTPTAACTFL
jgi:hypothetical protein